VSDGRFRLSRTCDNGAVLASDLRVDPVGNALIPVTSLPDRAAWEADLDGYLTAIRAAVPATRCGSGR